MKIAIVTAVLFCCITCSVYASKHHSSDEESVDFKRVYLDEIDEGAVCLDGSPGAYYLAKGSGSGRNKWIMHLMGGAYCAFPTSFIGDLDVPRVGCYERSQMGWDGGATLTIGTSKGLPESMDSYLHSNGNILDNDPSRNPFFYNWNRIYMIYCDGFAFTGNRSEPLSMFPWPFTKNIYFRGARILHAALDSLIDTKGMQGYGVTDFLLTGCSAGGNAVYIHADTVRDHLTARGITDIKYKALPDAGFFKDTAFDDTTVHLFRGVMKSAMDMHEAYGALHHDCILDNEGKEWKCYMAEHLIRYTKSPLLVLNTLYDWYQDSLLSGFFCVPPDCDAAKEEKINQLRDEIVEDIKSGVANNPSSGYYLMGCVGHCMTQFDDMWSSGVTVYDQNTAYDMQLSVAKWFYQDVPIRAVDSGFFGSTKNPTCKPYIPPIAPSPLY